MSNTPHFLLLQVRNAGDPIRQQEVVCFLRRLACDPHQLEVHDLLRGAPSVARWRRSSVVFLGGSGHYSAIDDFGWLDQTLDLLRTLHDESRPVFASCWGFQAMARALGGVVERDPQRAELGTLPVSLTPEGMDDLLFGPLGSKFVAHMGHEDSVVRLPPDARPLAFSERAEHQAFCFPGRPIYCTQFHPELDRSSYLGRVAAYPEYIHWIAGIPMSVFTEQCLETPAANTLLPRFVQHVLQNW